MARKNGRPKKMKEEDYINVGKLASLGLTKEMIADYFDYSYSTMYEDRKFSEVYRKNFAKLGAKVRTTLITKMEHDTTANIYLDKVINRTTEKFQEESIKVKRESLEIEKQKIVKEVDTETKVLSALEKLELELSKK